MDNIVIAEKYAFRKLKTMFRQAREAGSLTEEAERILDEAALFRKEYEESAVPMITRIEEDNIDRFTGLMTLDMAEEILVKKSHGIGCLRPGKDGSLYAVSSAVYHTEREGLENRQILRIKWLYVHPEYRNKGIGDLMLAEIMRIVMKNGISGATIDLPADTADTLMEEWLVKWQFSFEKGLEPDFILRLSDIGDIEEFRPLIEEVKSLSSVKTKDSDRLIHELLSKTGYDGFLNTVPKGYISPELSCYIDDGRSARALALTHVSPEQCVQVEYFYTSEGNEVLVLNLAIFIILSARKFLGRAATFRMSTDSFELGNLFDEAFPRQETLHLKEGIILNRRLDEKENKRR